MDEKAFSSLVVSGFSWLSTGLLSSMLNELCAARDEIESCGIDFPRPAQHLLDAADAVSNCRNDHRAAPAPVSVFDVRVLLCWGRDMPVDPVETLAAFLCPGGAWRISPACFPGSGKSSLKHYTLAYIGSSVPADLADLATWAGIEAVELLLA